jgi:N-methylhydantoinase B
MSHGIFGGYPGCHTGYSTFRNANVAQWPDSWEATRSEVREDKQWGSQEIKPGDIEYLRLTAGGGYGDPLDREPELVMRDVLGRMVTETCARDIYGVIVDVAAQRVDSAATKSKRIGLRAARLGVAPSKILAQRSVPATGKRIAEYLQENEQGEVQCTFCGTVLSRPGVHWKEVARSRRSPFSTAGPFRAGMEDYALGESFCPGCATLLDVDLVNGRDGLLRDEVVRWPEPPCEEHAAASVGR